MKTVRFASVSLILVALLSACPAATPDPPKASSVTVSGPSTNSLKLNEATAFTAIAKDSSGNAITGKTLAWTSSDEKIASVDSSGKVTAKHFGTVKITAGVDSITGSSATQTTYGLEARGGTIGNANGPAVLLRFRNADGSGTGGPVELTLSGPAGWNGNTTFKIQRPGNWKTNWFHASWFVNDLKNVSGNYQVNIPVGGQTFTSSFAVDVTQNLPVPSSPIASNISASSVTVNWSAVAGAVLYEVFIWNITDAQIANNSYRVTTGTSATLSGLTLQAGKPHHVVITAMNVNPNPSVPFEMPLPDQFNTTFASSLDFTL